MTATPEAVQHEAWTAAVSLYAQGYLSIPICPLRLLHLQIPVRLTLSASEVTTVEGPPAPLHVCHCSLAEATVLQVH